MIEKVYEEIVGDKRAVQRLDYRGFYTSDKIQRTVHSVQLSCSVVSDSLQPHALQHARPPCTSPTLGLCSKSCPALCDPMNCSMPGLPVHHQPPEFTQTHVHRVGDDIQPSHPLLSPSPPALNLSQHQGLFK